jgi:ABC-type uncharacterized transport system permease subunit
MVADTLPLKRSVPTRHVFAIYWRTWFAQIRSIVEYPADLGVMASAGALWNILQFAFIAVLFANVPDVAGWGFHEMLLLSGLLSLAGGSNSMFWDGIWSTGQMVLKGDIDYRITRPTPVVVQVGSAHIGMQSIGEMVLGLAMFVYGWIGAGIGWTAIPVGIAALVLAGIIQSGFVTALCAVNFWIKGPMSNFAFVMVDLQRNALNLPLGIFPLAVRIVAMFAIPVAFVNFVPVAVLTGHMPKAWLIGTPLTAVVAVLLATGVYRLGLRAYDSAGH